MYRLVLRLILTEPVVKTIAVVYYCYLRNFNMAEKSKLIFLLACIAIIHIIFNTLADTYSSLVFYITYLICLGVPSYFIYAFFKKRE